MPKNSKITHTATIERLSHEGRGITHVDGKTVFVHGALPGETVHFSYRRSRGSFDEGDVLKVLEAAPERVPAECPHFDVCGGCSLQHMTHNSQIKHKQESLSNLLQHQAKTTPEQWLPPLTKKLWGYRHKARLSVHYVAKKNKVLVGFRERNGRFVADITQCHILHPSVGKHLSSISECLIQLQARDTIPQIEVVIDDNTTALIIRHLKPLCEDDLQQLKALAQQRQYRLYLQPNDPDNIQLHWPETSCDMMQYTLPTYNVTLQFHPKHFIQINPCVNQAMIEQAIALLDIQTDDQVLDLFCGIGNFSLPIARTAKNVIGIEGDQGAVTQATTNTKINNLNNCRFHAADLFMPQKDAPWAQQRYDKVLLDPPRAGAKEILARLSVWRPKKIVYISCNPATLARDTAIIKQLGYTLSKTGIMDMFPHTRHVEAMAIFDQE